MPSLLRPDQLAGRTAVVIDTIRATTSMLTALANGAREIHVFSGIEECREAAEGCPGPGLLAGERRGAPIEGFHLGNEPAEFRREAVSGKTIFMTTTNGTRAILAARGAKTVLIGAFVNRRSLAEHLRLSHRDATFVCAGQSGQRASEDELAAHALRPLVDDLVEGSWPEAAPDVSWVHDRRYRDGEALRRRLLEMLPETTGGRTLIRHGFGEGLVDCGRADSLEVIGVADGRVVRRLTQPAPPGETA